MQFRKVKSRELHPKLPLKYPSSQNQIKRVDQSDRTKSTRQKLSITQKQDNRSHIIYKHPMSILIHRYHFDVGFQFQCIFAKDPISGSYCKTVLSISLSYHKIEVELNDVKHCFNLQKIVGEFILIAYPIDFILANFKSKSKKSLTIVNRENTIQKCYQEIKPIQLINESKKSLKKILNQQPIKSVSIKWIQNDLSMLKRSQNLIKENKSQLTVSNSIKNKNKKLNFILDLSGDTSLSLKHKNPKILNQKKQEDIFGEFKNDQNTLLLQNQSFKNHQTAFKELKKLIKFTKK